MEESISQGFYVYLYRYPQSMGGAIFYVGKGQAYNDKYDRIDDHEREARGQLRAYNARKIAIIKEIWAFGEEVVKEKVAFFESEEDALTYEWGLINMTAYAENLVNIRRGKGRIHRLDHDKIREYEPFCIQRERGRGGTAHLVVYHKISDIRSFCRVHGCIGIKMLVELLDGKVKRANGFSLRASCDCGYPSMVKGSELVHPIRSARLILGLSETQCADVCGVDPDQISSWEHGLYIPPPKTAKKIAYALGFKSAEEMRKLCKEWQSLNF